VRVSVITPCLNPGPLLVQCLDSVSAQTYEDVEHIVVDGGSTDGTVELVRSRGLQLISEPDRGQTDALNKGFALATGDYLGWLNADDWLVPHALERVVAAFAANPDVGWVYCDCEVRRENGDSEIARPPARLNRRTLELGNRLTQQGVFVARWALDRVGPLDEELDLVMDVDLWLRLIDADVPAAYIPEPLAVFLIHESSKTGSVDLSEWYREESVALLKSGRRLPAAAGLGRAAAAAALNADGRVDSKRLRASIGRFETIADDWRLVDERRVVRPAAYVEATRLELKASPRGIRHLARPAPWLSGTSRRMILGAARRAPRSLARRALKRVRPSKSLWTPTPSSYRDGGQT
jgi:GT2 family glycosyltransferase